MPSPASRTLPAAVVRFAALLRRHGLPVTPLHVADAVRALDHLDVGDRGEIYLGLRAVFVGRPEEIAVYDRCFDAFWRPQRDTDDILEGLAPSLPAEPDTGLATDGYYVNSGNSWVMAMEFGEAGPRARAVMVYSQSENPESPHFADQTALYAEEKMRPILFTEAEIAADPELEVVHLSL